MGDVDCSHGLHGNGNIRLVFPSKPSGPYGMFPLSESSHHDRLRNGKRKALLSILRDVSDETSHILWSQRRKVISKQAERSLLRDENVCQYFEQRGFS